MHLIGMATRPPLSGDRERSGVSKGLRHSLRVIWSAGGIWERFFLLSPLWWGSFAIALGAWATFSSQSFDVLMRIFLVAITFVGLVDAWWTPIMSASVLRATVGSGLNRSDENARLLSEYLESLGQGGRWRAGNILSLAYFLTMFAWGIVAVAFESLTGIQNNLAFPPLYLTSLFVLWGVYRIMLNRLLREARRAGYRVQIPRRSSS